MNYFVENWYMLVAAGAVIGMSIYVIVDFNRKPRPQQIEAVKQWLLGAVYDAEMAFNTPGMGELKLRMVYDCFTARFPWVAKLVSFDTFHEWVKEALERLPSLIESIEARQSEAPAEEVTETRAIGFYMEGDSQ